MTALFSELTRSADGMVRYQASLDRLDDLHPTLWLPAVPSYGQNANLYGDEWAAILARNREAARRGRYP